jgi:hypothetical protein
MLGSVLSIYFWFHLIEQAYKVSKYLVLWFQRTRFLKIGQSESKIASGGYPVQSTVTKSVSVQWFSRWPPSWIQKLADIF